MLTPEPLPQEKLTFFHLFMLVGNCNTIPKTRLKEVHSQWYVMCRPRFLQAL